MSFMYSDPRLVDKLLAKELNSLSFNDREALSEQLHGVRSLTPTETPEMLNNAFYEFQNEINKKITTLLIQLPDISSSSIPDISRSRSSGQQASAAAAASASSILPNMITSSSSIFSSLLTSTTNTSTRNSSNVSLRREYLMDILSTTPSLSSDYSNTTTNNNNNNNNNNTSDTESMDTSNGSINYNNNHNHNNKYSYIRSFQFCIKFLRCELFDIQKSVDRYLSCIDFLVDYFGVFALERPLYLDDLNKEEHKLLKEGQVQLMPSRDRSGRRVVVFLGSYGYGYSHMNRFRIIMYMMGQVASDDVCTQKNGLVVTYSRHSTNTVREIVEYGPHQTECNRWIDSVPVRISAFHCFLPDDITRGMILNMIGKRTRLITRIHTVRGITETEYLLRCFGIHTDDFPVTNTGSVKTKNLRKWIRQRTTLEDQQRNAGSSILAPHNQIVGIECPDLNSVLIRNGGPAWDHPGNIKFRSILIRREREREHQKTRPQKNQFLNSIIQESWANGLRFLSYVDENEWYVEITDYNILRTKVFQALRDQSARRKRLTKATATATANNDTMNPIGPIRSSSLVHHYNVSHDSSTNLFTGLDNNTSPTGCFLNFKKQKL